MGATALSSESKLSRRVGTVAVFVGSVIDSVTVPGVLAGHFSCRSAAAAALTTGAVVPVLIHIGAKPLTIGKIEPGEP